MIKVHRIEAENIRSLGHAVFEPLIDGGLTAVNGPNGAGKSSLLAAMMWALYGVTPDGVQQSAMRRQGTEGTCRVVVEFEHLDQVVTVERGLKGRKDTPYVIASVNGVEQAKGVKAATAWLVNLLGGLDVEGFLTAFVIRQKELDGLVKAKPAERRKLIERLAGIDRMSTAVKSAREEETEVRKRLELLPGDPEAVQAARDALEVAQQRAVDLWQAYEDRSAAAVSAQTALAAAETQAADLQARVDAHTQTRQALTEAQHRVSLTQQAVDASRRELDAARTAGTGGATEDVAAAQTAYEQAAAAVQDNQRAREAADRAIETARKDTEQAQHIRQRADRAAQAAAQARAAADQSAARAAGFPKDLPDQAERAERALAETTERRGALLGEHERISASIRAMEATQSGDSCCPTCATVLPDPSTVLATLRSALAEVETNGRAVKVRTEELTQTVRNLRTQVSDAQTAQSQAATAETQAQAAAQAASEADRDAVEAEATAAASVAAAEAAKTQAQSAAEQTTLLRTRHETAAEALRTAQVAAAALARVPDLTAAHQRAEQDAEQATTVLREAEAAELAARVDPELVDRVQVGLAEARTAAATDERLKVEAHGEFRVAEEQTKAAEKERDTQELRMRARAETYALLEQKTAVREALDEFRKDRIASLAPELSEIATDHIAKMTDGAFVAVELDEEFTPVVTDRQGRARPTSWLSGGEESAVALALRLAIGEVIAGQAGGLLWMDEPQTAMDAQRRPAMMATIRELPGRQPIIISHVSEATDMVDLVLDVVPDPDHGSSVAAARANTGTDEAMLDALDGVA